MIACELTLRYTLGLGDALMLEPDAASSYVIKPDQHVYRFFSHTDINHWSMRSPAFSLQKAPGVYRVLLIGDSMTYGSTQVDQKDIFSSLLQAELPAQLHTPVDVLNGSAGAWAIGNETGFLRSRGSFDADLVVLVLNSGDIAQPPATLSDLGGDAATVKPLCALCELWTRYLRDKIIPQHQSPKMDAGTTLSTNIANIKANLAYLGEFQALTKQDHARMGIVFLAMRKYVPEHAQTSAPEILADWAKQHQVPLIDATGAETVFSTEQMTRDGIHFKAKGHRVAATYIEQRWNDLDPARKQGGLTGRQRPEKLPEVR